VEDTLNATCDRVKQFFKRKLEKNLGYLQEKLVGGGMKTSEFHSYQEFVASMAHTLKSRFRLSIVNIQSTLEEQQKKYVNQFKMQKQDELRMLLDQENWQTV